MSGYLKNIGGAGDCLVRISDIQEGYLIRSADATALRVKRIQVHPAADRTFVELRSSTASLTVTASHRVLVPRSADRQPVQASSLKIDDEVCVQGARVDKLVAVNSFSASQEVVEITFQPDGPVEVFGESILSKGRAQPRTRRSQGHRGNGVEHPATDDGF